MQSQPSKAGIEAFASVASTYEAWFASPLGRFVDHQEKRAFGRILQGVEGGPILDIGAGTGHITTWLAERGYQVMAVEPSPAMRHEGVRRTAGLPIHWYDARAEHLPFPEASFHGAVLFTTLEFVQHPARALREALRVVCPGGLGRCGVSPRPECLGGVVPLSGGSWCEAVGCRTVFYV